MGIRETLFSFQVRRALERHHSSFSLSIIPVDYELGLILILQAFSFICCNSEAFTQLMVECFESHISCKKQSDGFQKVSSDF